MVFYRGSILAAAVAVGLTVPVGAATPVTPPPAAGVHPTRSEAPPAAKPSVKSHHVHRRTHHHVASRHRAQGHSSRQGHRVQSHSGASTRHHAAASAHAPSTPAPATGTAPTKP